MFKILILGHRRASSYGSSVAAMQNMPPQTPGHHPYQMIRGHSHEQLYGHPHPGQPMYSPYYYRKFFLTLKHAGEGGFCPESTDMAFIPSIFIKTSQIFFW